jgi:hypothetical protein
MTGPESTPRQMHEGETLRLIDLANAQGFIRNHDFLRCYLQGPALLVLSGGIVHFNYIDGFPNECFYEVEEDRERYPGAIIAFDCGFESCTFVNVGFAGPSDNLAAFKSSVGPL